MANFKSVSDGVLAILGQGHSDALTEQMHRRQIVKTLTSMRVAKGLTQDAIAKELGCNQSRVSKIENGVDSDLAIREIEAYAKVTGQDVSFLFSKRNQSLADQVKHHAFMIRAAFEKLIELAHKDDGIASGVAKLHFETFLNINRLLAESAEKLPVCTDNGKPYIRIAEGQLETSGTDSVDTKREGNHSTKKDVGSRPRKPRQQHC